MAEFDPNLNPKNLKSLREEFTLLNESLNNLSRALGVNAKEAAKATGDVAANFNVSVTATKSLVKEMEGLTKEEFARATNKEKLEKKVLKVKAEQAAVDAKIKVLTDKLAAATQEEASALTDVLAGLYEQRGLTEEVLKTTQGIEDTFDKMEKANPFKGLSDVTKDVPVLGKVFSGMAGAADTFNEKLAETNDSGKALAAASEEIATDLAKAGSAAFIGALVKGLGRADKRSVQLARSLGMSREEGLKLNDQFITAAASINGVTAANLAESLIEVNTALGTTSKLSTETLTTFNTLTKRLGVSGDEASKLTQFTLASGQNMTDFTQEAIGSVKVLNAQNDTAIDYKAILKDVSAVSNAVKLSTQAQGQNLAEAAFQAKKMGLSMGELDNIAGGLLDFEQSIANELEAELLLGKDLNLEKARAAALDGDLVTLGKELQKQGVTQEKFASMNRIEQESIAKAMGMTRESMADMFVEQKALANLNKMEGINADSMNDAIKQRLEQINKIEDADQRKLALEELKKTKGAEELVQQQQNLTLQEKQEQVLEQMGDIFTQLIPILDTIHGIFDFIMGNIEQISNSAAKFGAIMTGKNLMGAITKLKNGFLGIKNMIGGVLQKLGLVGGAVDDATKAVTGTAGKAAASGASKGFFGRIGSGIMSAGKSLIGGVSKAASFVAEGVSNLNPMKHIRKFFKGGGIGKFLKKIPILGTAISAIIAGMEVRNAARSGGADGQIDFQEVGKKTIQAIGGLGGGIVGGVLGSLIPVPGIGTFIGGIAGDALGRWIGGVIADNVDASGIGKAAVDIFGGGDEAADFISRPGQPVQKFRKDDIIIGATNPFGGGDDGKAIQLLERLVNAVEQGAVINMDGNKVGTALGMASYRTQ